MNDNLIVKDSIEDSQAIYNDANEVLYFSINQDNK